MAAAAWAVVLLVVLFAGGRVASEEVEVGSAQSAWRPPPPDQLAYRVERAGWRPLDVPSHERASNWRRVEESDFSPLDLAGWGSGLPHEQLRGWQVVDAEESVLLQTAWGPLRARRLRLAGLWGGWERPIGRAEVELWLAAGVRAPLRVRAQITCAAAPPGQRVTSEDWELCPVDAVQTPSPEPWRPPKHSVVVYACGRGDAGVGSAGEPAAEELEQALRGVGAARGLAETDGGSD